MIAYLERTLLQLEQLFLTRRLNSSPQDFCSILSRMSEIQGRLLQLDTWPTGFDAAHRWMRGE